MSKQTTNQANNRPKKYNPYYPTDYSIGRKRTVKPHEIKPRSDTKNTKTWFAMLFFGLIPLFNFILIAWSRKKNVRTTDDQKNFAKAAVILSVIFWIVVVAAAVAAYFMGYLSFLGI
jgi:hypothetical protein